jgi:hypothetical protein
LSFQRMMVRLPAASPSPARSGRPSPPASLPHPPRSRPRPTDGPCDRRAGGRLRPAGGTRRFGPARPLRGRRPAVPARGLPAPRRRGRTRIRPLPASSNKVRHPRRGRLRLLPPVDTHRRCGRGPGPGGRATHPRPGSRRSGRRPDRSPTCGLDTDG